MKRKNYLEWEVNELFPISNFDDAITLGTCASSESGQYVGPVISIDKKFNNPRVSRCVSCTPIAVDFKKGECCRLIHINRYEFYVFTADTKTLIVRTPSGGCYAIRKTRGSGLKILSWQIRRKPRSDDEDDDEDGPGDISIIHPSPPRFMMN